MSRPSLALRYHRGTTAHVASVYPFSVQGSFGHRGVYVGVDLLAGGAEFCWDPFEAYQAGLVTNPNSWVLGEPGNGKSALVKTLLWRQAAVYGTGDGGRWVAVADPKGEYVEVAQRLGFAVVSLSPGGDATLNPLAPGPAAAFEPPQRQVLRRAEMCVALIGTVLDRPLTQVEDAVVFAAVEQLVAARGEPTLMDVARLVGSPTDEMTANNTMTANTFRFTPGAGGQNGTVYLASTNAPTNTTTVGSLSTARRSVSRAVVPVRRSAGSRHRPRAGSPEASAQRADSTGHRHGLRHRHGQGRQARPPVPGDAR